MAATHLPDQISLTPPGSETSLALVKLDISAAVAGFNCQTVMTMTFKNPAAKKIEGELNFPLPESGVVSGFAYEIDGRMVDGVIVEKEAARVAFEKEVRSGGNAALVEVTKGNSFKTRIYPIPPSGTISVKVTYLSDVDVGTDGANFSIPMKISTPVDQLKLKLTIRGQPAKVRDGELPDLKFVVSGEDFVTEVELPNFKSKKNLVVGLPQFAHDQVLTGTTQDKESFFLVHDLPAQPDIQQSASAVNSVAVVWDASLSMERVDKKRAHSLLAQLGALPNWKSAKWNLIVVRHETEPSKQFDSADALVNVLKSIDYDGGTDLGSIRWLGGDAVVPPRTCSKGHALQRQVPKYKEGSAWNCDCCTYAQNQTTESNHCDTCGDFDMCDACFSAPPKGSIATPYDKILFFTDGLSNLSDDMPSTIPTSPVFVLCAASQSNAKTLTHLANKTGGRYLDLLKVPEDSTLISAISNSDKFQFISAEFDAKELSDVVPSQPTPILKGEKFTIGGRLLVHTASIKVSYGINNKITSSKTIQLRKNDSEDSLLSKLWAQLKIAELSVFPEQNKAELLDLGRKYGVVTSGASLLVLTDGAAYLKHGITPNAKAQPDAFKTFTDAKKKEEDEKKRAIDSKISSVLNMFNARKQWWDTDFSKELQASTRKSWEETMKQENPKAFEHSGSPPNVRAGPPAEHATKAMTEADLPKYFKDHSYVITVNLHEQDESLHVEKQMESKSEESECAKGDVSEKKMKDRSKNVKAKRERRVDREEEAEGDRPCKPQRANNNVSMASPASASLVSADMCAAPAAMMSAPSPASAPPPSRSRMAAPTLQAAPPRSTSTSGGPAPPPPPPAAEAPSSGASNLDDGESQSGISIKAWSPDQPYLNQIKSKAKNEQYKEYIKQRASYRDSPAFYLDVSTYFFADKELRPYGHRVLTSIADLGLEEPGLMRIIGYKLSNENLLRQSAAVFEKVLNMRKNEPQSYRDLANVHGELGNFERALKLFNEVLIGKWDSRFNEIEITVLMEANRLWDIVKRKKLTITNPIDARLTGVNFECDVRISCGWDTDMTDIDLHVREPDGNECYYGRNRTPAGGLVSRDFTQGYGPEEYMIKFGVPGKYVIKVRYYASHAQTLSGGTTILLHIFTDFGRGQYERVQKTTVRLQQNCDNFEVASIDFQPSGPRRELIQGWQDTWYKELEQRLQWAEEWKTYTARVAEVDAAWRKYESEEQRLKSANDALIESHKEKFAIYKDENGATITKEQADAARNPSAGSRGGAGRSDSSGHLAPAAAPPASGTSPRKQGLLSKIFGGK